MKLWDRDQKPAKNFKVINELIPRFYHALFDSSIEQITLTFEGVVDHNDGNLIFVTAEKARATYWLKDGTNVSRHVLSGIIFLTQLDYVDWQSRGHVFE